MPRDSQIWMSHSDTVQFLPEGTKVIASNQDNVPVALQWNERFFGIQFHPEVTHSHEGARILKNFLDPAAKNLAPFNIASFKDQILDAIRREVNGREVLCGVSGGVDSTVLAVLLHRAGVKTRCVVVDHGLLRKNERGGGHAP